MDDGVMLQLPVDMIDKILSHITDLASLARLASTCKFWHNIIKGRSFLDCLRKRRHDHGFTPYHCSLVSSTRTTMSPLNNYYNIKREVAQFGSHNLLAAKLDARPSHLLNFALSFGVLVPSSTFMSPSHLKVATWPSATT
jgi:hypothetical protein